MRLDRPLCAAKLAVTRPHHIIRVTMTKPNMIEASMEWLLPMVRWLSYRIGVSPGREPKDCALKAGTTGAALLYLFSGSGDEAEPGVRDVGTV
jgi:hypothetical protein